MSAEPSTELVVGREPVLACCREVIARYRELVPSERNGAALFCPACKSRLRRLDGAWKTEEP